MRFFRTQSEAVYEQARLTLDAAWGHVEPITCIEPAATAPRDAQGRIVLAVDDEFCAYEESKQMLTQMLSAGAATEISEAQYRQAVHRDAP